MIMFTNDIMTDFNIMVFIITTIIIIMIMFTNDIGIGRFVKLELYFASKWILISEVIIMIVFTNDIMTDFNIMVFIITTIIIIIIMIIMIFIMIS